MITDHVNAAIDYYLKATSFGVCSLWKHGKYGKSVATKARKLLLGCQKDKDVVALVCAISRSRTPTLTKYMLRYLVFGGCFDANFLFQRLVKHADLVPECREIRTYVEALHKLRKDSGVKEDLINHYVQLLKEN